MVDPRTIVAVLPSGVAATNRTVDEFYVVLVQGAENAKRLTPKGTSTTAPCETSWAYDLDVGERVLRYDDARFPIDPNVVQIVVAVDYEAPSVGATVGEDCRSVDLLAAYNGRATYRGQVRDGFPLDLVVEPQNGFLTYNRSYFLPLGKKVHVNFTRVEQTDGVTFRLTGDFEVVGLGAWPKTALHPVSAERRR